MTAEVSEKISGVGMTGVKECMKWHLMYTIGTVAVHHYVVAVPSTSCRCRGLTR